MQKLKVGNLKGIFWEIFFTSWDQKNTGWHEGQPSSKNLQGLSKNNRSKIAEPYLPGESCKICSFLKNIT